MNPKRIEALENLRQQHQRDEERYTEELARRARALETAGQERARAEAEQRAHQDALAASDELRRRELAGGCTAARLRSRAAHRSRLEADLRRASQRAEAAGARHREAEAAFHRTQRELALAGARRKAAEQEAEQLRREARRRSQDRRDEEQAEILGAHHSSGEDT